MVAQVSRNKRSVFSHVNQHRSKHSACQHPWCRVHQAKKPQKLWYLFIHFNTFIGKRR